MHDYSKLSGKKRLRFRDWLIQKLDSREIKGVEWLDRQRGLFKIPWVHGSRQNWCMTDAEIFSQWAKYSGKYREGKDIPNPIKWKTNFRCTLNALPDFKEVRAESCPRGPKGYKIYKLKSSAGKAKKEQNACEKGEKQATAVDPDLTDKEIIQLVDEMMAPAHIGPAVQKPLLVPRPNSAFPAFESLVLCRSADPSFTFSYTPWFLWAWNAMAVDQHVEKPEEDTAEENDGESASKETDDIISK